MRTHTQVVTGQIHSKSCTWPNTHITEPDLTGNPTPMQRAKTAMLEHATNESGRCSRGFRLENRQSQPAAEQIPLSPPLQSGQSVSSGHRGVLPVSASSSMFGHTLSNKWPL